MYLHRQNTQKSKPSIVCTEGVEQLSRKVVSTVGIDYAFLRDLFFLPEPIG
jgi:hypothetical protein